MRALPSKHIKPYLPLYEYLKTHRVRYFRDLSSVLKQPVSVLHFQLLELHRWRFIVYTPSLHYVTQSVRILNSRYEIQHDIRAVQQVAQFDIDHAQRREDRIWRWRGAARRLSALYADLDQTRTCACGEPITPYTAFMYYNPKHILYVGNVCLVCMRERWQRIEQSSPGSAARRQSKSRRQKKGIIHHGSAGINRGA